MSDTAPSAALGLPTAIDLLKAILHRRARGRDDALEWGVALLKLALDQNEILPRSHPAREGLLAELAYARHWLDQLAGPPAPTPDQVAGVWFRVARALEEILKRLEAVRRARQGRVSV